MNEDMYRRTVTDYLKKILRVLKQVEENTRPPVDEENVSDYAYTVSDSGEEMEGDDVEF